MRLVLGITSSSGAFYLTAGLCAHVAVRVVGAGEEIWGLIGAAHDDSPYALRDPVRRFNKWRT
jgi:hypothetical protein